MLPQRKELIGTNISPVLLLVIQSHRIECNNQVLSYLIIADRSWFEALTIEESRSHRILSKYFFHKQVQVVQAE